MSVTVTTILLWEEQGDQCSPLCLIVVRGLLADEATPSTMSAEAWKNFEASQLNRYH